MGVSVGRPEHSRPRARLAAQASPGTAGKAEPPASFTCGAFWAERASSPSTYCLRLGGSGHLAVTYLGVPQLLPAELPGEGRDEPKVQMLVPSEWPRAVLASCSRPPPVTPTPIGEACPGSKAGPANTAQRSQAWPEPAGLVVARLPGGMGPPVAEC